VIQKIEYQICLTALHAEWHALGGISPWTEANINTPQTEGADNSQAEEECSWAPISFFVFFFLVMIDWVLLKLWRLLARMNYNFRVTKRKPLWKGGFTISTFSYLLLRVVPVALISCRQQLPWARRLNSPAIWPSLSGHIWPSLSLSHRAVAISSCK